jgi:hypothetical protein
MPTRRYTQLLRQRFMRELEFVDSQSVTCHQQPGRAARFDWVKRTGNM